LCSHRPGPDLRRVLDRADQIIRNLPNSSAGYWQIRAYLDAPGAVITLFLGDDGQPVDEDRSRMYHAA
jgi:hypothetical protein